MENFNNGYAKVDQYNQSHQPTKINGKINRNKTNYTLILCLRSKNKINKVVFHKNKVIQQGIAAFKQAQLLKQSHVERVPLVAFSFQLSCIKIDYKF